MSDQMVFVRLKPYDPKRGNLKETFRVGAAAGWNDFVFEAGRVVEINRSAAEWLRTVRQRDYDESSAAAFEIWETEAELVAALRAERIAALQRMQNSRPTVEEVQPPKLEVARYSQLDAPPSVHEMELRRLEMAALTPEIQPGPQEQPEAEDMGPDTTKVLDPLASNAIDPDSAFTDLAPTDEELLAQAMDPDDSEPAEEQPEPPPLQTAPPRKRQAKTKARTPRKRTSRG